MAVISVAFLRTMTSTETLPTPLHLLRDRGCNRFLGSTRKCGDGDVVDDGDGDHVDDGVRAQYRRNDDGWKVAGRQRQIEGERMRRFYPRPSALRRRAAWGAPNCLVWRRRKATTKLTLSNGAPRTRRRGQSKATESDERAGQWSMRERSGCCRALNTEEPKRGSEGGDWAVWRDWRGAVLVFRRHSDKVSGEWVC